VAKEEPAGIEEGLSIIIPVFNERDTIRLTLSKMVEVVSTLTVPVEIIVVDDSSHDGTDQTLVEFSNKRIKIIRHPANRGYGAALKSGLGIAAYPVIAITDADGTYPNELIPELFKKMQTDSLDMVVGARTGENVEIPFTRRPAKWVLNKIANYLAGFKIPDLNSGLRIFRKDVALKFKNILPDGFSFTTTITLAMVTNGYRVDYESIDYRKRGGKSKIRPVYDTLNFLQLIIRTVLYFNPLKIFLPISGIFVFLSFVLMLYRLLIAEAFGVTSVVLFVCGIQFLGLGMIADLIDRRL